MDNFLLFLNLGFRHILEGYDHLLFLGGLLLIKQDLKSLLKVISAFTIAHSTTLILSALGILSLNPTLTETLIAVSITYVGIENLFRREYKNRWVISFSFGLIHGAGFSGHLTELLKSMLGFGNIWMPLLGFNFGIEAGQLIVVAISLPTFAILRKLKNEKIIIPATSLLIAACGFLLIIERLLNV